MNPFDASELTLDAVLGDLRTIATIVIAEEAAGGASISAVESLMESPTLDTSDYIKFMEIHGFADVDRIGDRISMTPEGRAAAADPELWREQAEMEFLENDSTRVSSMLGALSDDVDDLLDSIAEFSNAEHVDDIGAQLMSADDLDDPPTMGPDDIQFPGGTTDPEVLTPPTTTPSALSTPLSASARSAPAKPAATGAQASTSGPRRDLRPQPSSTMSNDSFSSRRLSSQSPAAARPAATSSSSAASRGETLYQRGDAIGSGGMGTVYKGTQVKLNRAVAIKEIKEIFDVFAGVQRADIVDRFTDVVQIQATLLHPNIIQVVDLDTDAQFPFVVMQYAPNGNLRRLIESDDRPPLQTALKYFLQIVHALNTAHDNGVTHGGLKPENIVLDHAGNALVTDFGISRVAELDANNSTNQVYVGVGTVAYMSPEQFRDPNIATVKSDIYSLGIMFYEMLTGKVPGRRSPMPSSFFPDIPRSLDDVFDRMSMDDINERYASVEEVLTDIYSSGEVMDIIDKRGGFLFLRDPITHGEAGGLALFDDDSPAVARPAAEGDADAEDGDVLDKLDKYSNMFDGDDEDDDDIEEDSDASDASEASEADDDSDASEADGDGDDDDSDDD